MTDTKEPRTGVSKAVATTLAGVLAVGMVPAAAFAEAIEETEAAEGLELLANASATSMFPDAELNSAIAISSITGTPTGKEAALTITDGVVHIGAVDSDTTVVTPTKLTLADGTVIDPYGVDSSDGRSYSITYFASTADGTAPTGSALADGAVKAAATYWVKVTALDNDTASDGENADGIDENTAFQFKVVVDKADISSATIWNSNATLNPKSDVTYNTFTYNLDGSAQDVATALDGKTLAASAYDVEVYKSDKTKLGTSLASIINADTYTAILTGKGKYTGTATVSFTVDKFQLTADNVAFTTPKGAAGNQPSANGYTTNAVKIGGTAVASGKVVTVTLTEDPKGYKDLGNGPGVFKYDVAFNLDAATGTPAFKDNVVTDAVSLEYTEVTTSNNALIEYNGTTWAATLDTDLSATTPTVFDTSKITAKDGSTEIPYTVTITDADGNDATSKITNTAGVYTVKVTIDSAKCDYKYAGEQTCTVTVINKDMSGVSPLVKFQGETIANNDLQTVVYTGKDWLEDLDVTIKSGETELTADDYTLYIEKNSVKVDSGKVVDPDATYAYLVYVQAPEYKITGTSMLIATISVGLYPLDATNVDGYDDSPISDTLRVAGMEDPDEDGTYNLYWDGEDIVPAFEYVTDVDDKGTPADNADDVYTFATLDSSLYTLTLKKGAKTVSAIDGADSYTFTLTAAEGNEEAAKYNWDDANGTIVVIANQYEITDESVKTDGNGKPMGTVTGIAATAVDVASEQSFTAKAADGYEIANVSITADGEDVEYTEEDGKYTFKMPAADVTVNVVFQVAGFNDTDDSVFADVINKAATAGLVHGYADGSFRPNKTITRAEVATILYNAATDNAEDETDAANKNGYYTGFDDVAETYWAAPFISWAKAAGVVNGNGGKFRPNDPVTREEFAAMLANYVENVDNTALADGELPISRVKDYDSVASWAKAVVKWAVTNGVMGNGGAVQPKAKATRGEVTAMLVNYLDTTGYFD